MSITLARRGASGSRSTVARDYFTRADGGLGANWTAGSDLGPHITSNQVAGDATFNRQSIRSAETYGSDHYSEIQVGSASPSSGDWYGVGVRMQAAGQTCYAVIYFNNPALSFNSYVLQVFKRVAGTFTQLDPAPTATSHTGYTLPGALNAGDIIRLSVAGNVLTVSVNGVRVTKITDASIPSGGAPGILTFGGTGALDNWAGDNAKAEPASPVVTFTSSPPNTARNGLGHNIRVLNPVPSQVPPGVPHNFLYALSVEKDGVSTYGDPMDMLYGLGAHNLFNLTIVQPNFDVAGPTNGPWYINPSDPVTNPTYQNDTYMASDLRPWVIANYSTSGLEKHWLIGFSKSGWGGMQLIFHHPTLFDKCAAWDWPFSAVGSQFGGFGLDPQYGNAAYIDANYTMTSAFLDTFKAPFQAQQRLWIGGHDAFAADVAAAHTQFNAKGMLHAQQTDLSRTHEWQSGWVIDALNALAAMP